MKLFAFAVGLMGAGALPLQRQRALDYAVVRFDTGYCQIWWDGSARALGRQLDQGRHDARVGSSANSAPVRRDRRQDM